MKTPKPFTATTTDMAILLDEQLSTNQGYTPEGYLVCTNVPVSRTGVQYYYGREIHHKLTPDKLYTVYRLAEDVFEDESLKSIESKPITDDHPQQAVTVHNAGFLSRGHGRNVRHDEKNVVVDLVCTDPTLIQGVRDKRKYEISLGYTANYVPYKDGFKQTNIRVNHIAVVESGRAGRQVAIRDKAPVRANRRHSKMDQTKLKMLQLFIQDADTSAEEAQAALESFIKDAAAPISPKQPEREAAKDETKGLLALFGSLMSKDAKPAAKPEAAPLTEDAIKKLVADAVAEAIKPAKAKPTKDKKTKDSDEEEVEKMLEDEDPDEEKETTDSDEEKETEDEEPDEEATEAKDAAFADVVKAIQPLYKTLPKKERAAVRDALVKAKKTPSADSYAGILKAVQSHQSKDAAPVADTRSVSDKVMAARNPHHPKYGKK